MKVYNVGELTRIIKSILEDNLSSLWVEGEISEYTRHQSGHHYFTLKDSESVLSCVMWRGMTNSLTFTPQPGMKVIVQGRITVFEKGGRYQLEARTIQLSGEGELMAAFERMKAKLSEEGLFAVEHKKTIPRFPWKIGLVTSATGAAIRDLVSVANRRNPAVELIIYPARVQGGGAAEEIAHAIEAFNRYGEVDLLIVGRGGGSIEDLWCFNEEAVARAIYASKIPVISAVGHEVDFSIADLVADMRAPTPSAAAELAVPDAGELLRDLQDTKNRMQFSLENRIQRLREKIDWAKRSRAFSRPMDMLREYSQRLDEMRRRMETGEISRLERIGNRLDSYRSSLNALNPLGVLKRGYSIVRRQPDSKVISDAGDLTKGDKVNITFHRGTASGKIERAESDVLPL